MHYVTVGSRVPESTKLLLLGIAPLPWPDPPEPVLITPPHYLQQHLFTWSLRLSWPRQVNDWLRFFLLLFFLHFAFSPLSSCCGQSVGSARSETPFVPSALSLSTLIHIPDLLLPLSPFNSIASVLLVVWSGPLDLLSFLSISQFKH